MVWKKIIKKTNSGKIPTLQNLYGLQYYVWLGCVENEITYVAAFPQRVPNFKVDVDFQGMRNTLR